MEHFACVDEESPLLTILPLIQRLVFSSIDRKEFPYSKSQMTIFTVLSIRKELTMKEVAGYLSSSREQATRAIAPLVDAGLIDRFTDPANRVHVYVRLTEAGQNYLTHLRDLVHQAVGARLEESVTPEESQELSSMLIRSIEILKKVK